MQNRYFAPGHYESEAPADRILIRDLVLAFRIGIYEREKQAPQRVRLNLEVEVEPRGGPPTDEIDQVVSYEQLITQIKALAEGTHINLVETLAERLAEICLADSRTKSARVRVEKLDVEAAADAVGVEIERRRTWSAGRLLQSPARPGPAAESGGETSVVRAFRRPRPDGGGGADD